VQRGGWVALLISSNAQTQEISSPFQAGDRLCQVQAARTANFLVGSVYIPPQTNKNEAITLLGEFLAGHAGSGKQMVVGTST
jgi:hypothetical protein